MRLHFANERVLAVVAHPDDAELFSGGTLARAKADGAAIGICVVCQGDKGKPRRQIHNLTAVRRNEMTASGRLVGARLFEGGFPDGTLEDNRRSRARLVEIYREFRPTLVLAHSPTDYHPDHRAVAAVAEAATWFCASRGHGTTSPPLPTSPALWWMDTIEMLDFTPGFYIDITPYTRLKEQMLACHKSQLMREKDGDFSPLATLMRRQSSVRGAQAGVEAAEAFQAYHAFKRGRAW